MKDHTSPAITSSDLRSRLFLVADDSMGGRPTGSPGHVMVTDYIASELRRLGLQPAGDDGTWFQNVPFVRLGLTAGSGMRADGRALRPAEFTPVSTGNVLRTFPGAYRPIEGAQLIYGGLVNDSSTQITSEEAAGKAVVLRARGNGIMIPPGTPDQRWGKAAAVIIVTSDYAKRFWPVLSALDRPLYSAVRPDSAAAALPQFLMVSPDGARTLFGDAWTDSIASGTRGPVLRGNLAFEETRLTARNVVAILPGSDPALRGQYVALGAHSDHDAMKTFALDHDSLRIYNERIRRMNVELGRPLTGADYAAARDIDVDSLRAIRPARLDSIMNGADDDASGSVALLEIAESMAASATKPQRSVLFVWHVAEELGLFGAKYFTQHAAVPLDSIVAQLNVDMIGRGGAGEVAGGGPAYLQLIGARRLSNDLGDVIDAANAALPQSFTFDLTFDADGHPERFYCRSDHYEYARFGIPVAFFTTGGHGDYHQVTDEPQYIDYPKLQAVTQLIHDVALQLGTAPARPAVDGPRPDPSAVCVQ